MITKWITSKRYAPYLVFLLTPFWIAAYPILAIFAKPLPLHGFEYFFLTIGLIVQIVFDWLAHGVLSLPKGYKVELKRYDPRYNKWLWQINTGSQILHKFPDSDYDYVYNTCDTHLGAISAAGHWVQEKQNREIAEKQDKELVNARKLERNPIYMRGYKEVYDPEYVKQLEKELELRV